MKDIERTAIVLLNLGGPDSLAAVEPFLFNLFSDPDIIPLPLNWLLRRPFARFISSRRSKEVAERYRLIGGKSPIRELTERQAAALQKELGDSGAYKVFIAMRYWHPLTEEIALQVAREGFNRVLLVPLYPHYSIVTTGSSFNEWNRVSKRHGIHFAHERLIPGFADWAPYINAMEEKIREGLRFFSSGDGVPVHFLFSAHGIPVSIIENGDPYAAQILTSVDRIMKRFDGFMHHISFQSKVGRAKWLEPSTIRKVAELGAQGVKKLLVIPVSFVSDHIETLDELDIQIREDARKAGIGQFKVMPALNDSPAFIMALAELIREEMSRWLAKPGTNR